MNRSLFPPGWPTKSDWTEVLDSALASPNFLELFQFIETERLSQTIYPSEQNVFNAFRLTPYAQTKVVILGQDPYHGPNQAHGLSFSVEEGNKLPPSLKNIFKELSADLDIPTPITGNLSPWAQQGVFLLNTVLTVQKSQANSHRKRGWERFTDQVIQKLDEHPSPIVFVLWGKPAEKKAKLIKQSQHIVLTAPHPSPLSAYRGFFGSQPFSKINRELTQRSIEAIDWRL
ncbi:uracil-DNA glycosylase [Mariniblastus sp.]|nr:uracil-DNA glycosylase [Mariniblastus sp.]